MRNKKYGLPVVTNGSFVEFETMDAEQVRIRSEVADGFALGFAVAFTAPFAIGAIEGGVLAVNGSTSAMASDLLLKANQIFWRYAPAIGTAGRTAAELFDESGSAGMQNAALGKLEKFAAAQIKKFIPTEEGALYQVEKFKQIIINGGDEFEKMMKDPIHAVTYNGKNYILDGHNRLKAFADLGEEASVTILSVEEANKLYKDKMEDIISGGFKKEIQHDQ